MGEVNMFQFLRKNEQNQDEKKVVLVACLGNPGREYKQTRHNIGFMVAEKLSADLSIRMGKVQANAIIGIGPVGSCRVVIAKPQTYMNLSGRSVKSLLQYYKIPLDKLIVIHDDLDLPFGTLRIRQQGGPGGQKGIKSIIEMVGTQVFNRIRMGIDRPPGRMDPADYVLQRFSPREEALLPDFIHNASLAVQTILSDGIDKAMNQYNGPVL
jgi:PTH1 family peptidyl-tRNA hydrolase